MATSRKKSTKTLKHKSVKSKAKKAAVQTDTFNHEAHWKAYKELQTKAEKAWIQLRNNVKKNAPAKVLVKDQSNLLLLLGECNYMQRECTRMAATSKKRRK
ncbi:MAG: hypothetical protein COT85_00560 [Chlamydiae bacterium CG10_big_fil_rev_8_21_14_0_10_42_34]|nr:MAG: hypothetical protein COT85_00560 [Chlamydiae bacterium CG10_big_fil_rev_8_21_14_0_10_42_34]